MLKQRYLHLRLDSFRVNMHYSPFLFFVVCCCFCNCIQHRPALTGFCLATMLTQIRGRRGGSLLKVMVSARH